MTSDGLQCWQHARIHFVTLRISVICKSFAYCLGRKLNSYKFSAKRQAFTTTNTGKFLFCDHPCQSEEKTVVRQNFPVSSSEDGNAVLWNVRRLLRIDTSDRPRISYKLYIWNENKIIDGNLSWMKALAWLGTTGGWYKNKPQRKIMS